MFNETMMDNIDVDPGVYIAIQRGILAGIGILTFFVFFPGEPFDFKENIKEGEEELTSESDMRNVIDDGQKRDNETKQSREGRLKKEGELMQDEDTNPLWIFQWAVYGIIVMGIMHVLKVSYGVDVSLFLEYYFPREAALLKF